MIAENNNDGSHFVYCEICGKKLIKRLPNGLFHFAFGKSSKKAKPPVNMYIHGSVKMECLSDACEHMNTLNYFPYAPAKSEPNGTEEETSTN